jgi:hypothetical protein
VVLQVDTEEGHLALVGLIGLLEAGQLYQARGAPGGKEIDHQRLSAVDGQPLGLAGAKPRERELGQRLALGRRRAGGGTWSASPG